MHKRVVQDIYPEILQANQGIDELLSDAAAQISGQCVCQRGTSVSDRDYRPHAMTDVAQLRFA